MDQESRTGIRIIPPVILLVAVVVGSLIDWPLPIHTGLPTAVRWPLGLVLVVAPLAVMPSVFAAFHRAGSEYDTRKVPQGLVTEGLFRFSRNPGYIASIILGVGLGIAFNNVWLIAMMVPYAIIVHTAVVLKEEVVLERVFGQEYLEYKQHVRRWI
jgi:protein-S-isoprenylcysteine O-methyltransferase Ste14